MTMYQELSAADVLGPLLERYPEIEAKPTIKLTSKISLPHPWIHSVPSCDRDCGRWLRMYFKLYQIIPKQCLTCWKIAFSPVSLKEAFDTIELQKELGYSSKVGMETRNYTGNNGGYSAFWYAPLGCGLHKARGMFTIVKHKVQEKLKRKVKIILKRGCTEFERTHGSSDNWDKIREEMGWTMKQDLLDAVFESDNFWKHAEMPKFLEVNTRLNMIHWAFEHNDQTYLEYTGGQLIPSLLDYSKSIHSDKDFPEVKYDSSRYEATSEEGGFETTPEERSSVPGDGRILAIVPPVESEE